VDPPVIFYNASKLEGGDALSSFSHLVNREACHFFYVGSSTFGVLAIL
jgi:hypothetical protein